MVFRWREIMSEDKRLCGCVGGKRGRGEGESQRKEGGEELEAQLSTSSLFDLLPTSIVDSPNIFDPAFKRPYSNPLSSSTSTMTVAGPSLVLPTLSTIFSSSTPPTALFPQTIVLLHTVREWIPIILQEAEKRIIQKEKENEIRKNKGKGKAREEGGEEGEELELVQLRKLRVSFGKGKKLEGKGLNLELALKAVVSSIYF